MTKDELVRLARAAAEAASRLQAWAMVNVSSDPEKRLHAAAEYKIAHSVHQKAEAEYQAVVAALSASELDRIMREGGSGPAAPILSLGQGNKP